MPERCPQRSAAAWRRAASTPSAAPDPLTSKAVDDEAIADRFRRDFDRLRSTDTDAPVLIAVSGGADSLALLLLAQAEIGDRCIAATVDHGLRAESAAEAAHVAAICASRGIRHTILRGALPARAGKTANVSARARLMRYDLLDRHRARMGAAWTATAHHADDQLETIVMRLNRGAGVSGLAGIREVNGAVIRPLLEWRRETLAAIVERAGIVAVADPSNVDDRFDRARLRKALAGADWLDRERAAHAAHNLNAADEALDWAADDLFARSCRIVDGAVSWTYRALPGELLRRMVQRCVTHVDPDANCGKLALTRVIHTLERNEQTMIGDVLCRVQPPRPADRTDCAIWCFERAPPRRSG